MLSPLSKSPADLPPADLPPGFRDPETLLHELGQAVRRGVAGRPNHRPFVTLTYAQSLDGSISLSRQAPLALSGRESLCLTHSLRAWHRAILVGIQTVLADDPSLTVRLVPGENPLPVVLDSTLRLPLASKLVQSGSRGLVVAGTTRAGQAAARRLRARQATVLLLAADRRGWVSLPALLDQLGRMGVTSLMVEGGSRVLGSFLRHRLVDQVVVTLAPVLAGGLRAFGRLAPRAGGLPRLAAPVCAAFGQDLVIWGRPVWDRA
ncbi:MAG: RibD family protein [Deltaproteobacteria bacterium]|nr:RibD family protein [Deltaproteobacteria bacterium]